MKKKKIIILIYRTLLVFVSNLLYISSIFAGGVEEKRREYLAATKHKIIFLDVKPKQVMMMPSSEDYKHKLSRYELRSCLTGKDITSNLRDKGFLDRAEAITLTFFSNAEGGAKLFVHGIQPATRNILRLEDTFLSVMTEKTYILANNIEGASAEGPGKYKYCTDLTTAKVVFLQISNEAQQIFAVTRPTKDPRVVVFRVGIANLNSYTEGEYRNTLIFTLMPIVDK